MKMNGPPSPKDATKTSEPAIRINTCGHIFCRQCLSNFIHLKTAMSNTCPFCRTVMFKPDIRTHVRSETHSITNSVIDMLANQWGFGLRPHPEDLVALAERATVLYHSTCRDQSAPQQCKDIAKTCKEAVCGLCDALAPEPTWLGSLFRSCMPDVTEFVVRFRLAYVIYRLHNAIKQFDKWVAEEEQT